MDREILNSFDLVMENNVVAQKLPDWPDLICCTNFEGVGSKANAKMTPVIFSIQVPLPVTSDWHLLTRKVSQL